MYKKNYTMSDFPSFGENISIDALINDNKNNSNQSNVLAPSEIFKKLTGSKSKKKINFLESIPKRYDESTKYTWNPTLEHQFRPVKDLKATMAKLFKKDEKKISNKDKTDIKKETQKFQKHSIEHKKENSTFDDDKIVKRKFQKDSESENEINSSSENEYSSNGEDSEDFNDSDSENYENEVLKHEVKDESDGEFDNQQRTNDKYSFDEESNEEEIEDSENDIKDESEENSNDDNGDNENSGDSDDSDDNDELSSENIERVRKQFSIHISSSVGGVGSDRLKRKENLSEIPPPALNWKDLNIPDFLMKKIQKRGYDQLTPVQMQGIPIMTKLNKDFVCIAPTGTGKTLTFLLAMLEKIKPCKLGSKKNDDTIYPFRGLIISPTKVLASQIYEEFQYFTRKTAWKTRILGHNKDSTKISRFNDILIATPKRMAMAIKEGLVNLSTIEYLIFDEADKLFESGYLEQIDEIVTSCTHPNLLRAMFSATMPLGIEQMVNSIMNDYIRLIIGKKNTGSSNVDQKLDYVGTDQGKLDAIKNLILQGVKVPILIFVQSKKRAQELHHQLTLLFSDNIFPVDVLHSSNSNTENMKIVHQFEEGRIWALIATDVAARGIDFKDVSTVINYDFPYDMMTYIHRIGRTGRADKRGTSITYVTHTDIPALRMIAELMKKSGCHVDEWMLNIKSNDSLIEKRKLIPPKRNSILNPNRSIRRHFPKGQKRKRGPNDNGSKPKKTLKQ